MKKEYKKIISDCTECPFFEEETEYENTFADCPRIEKLEFFCNKSDPPKKIADANKSDNGIWDNSRCEIPEWCTLETVKELG